MIVRRLASRGGEIFLTFDDGPDPLSTPPVLEVLKTHGVPATFYLVAEKAKRETALLARIQSEGHAIGNHSLDHRYRYYFKGAGSIDRWVQQAEDEFHRLGIRELAGFRPPAGIITRALVKVAGRKNLPLVLWNERFHDAVFPWTFKKASRSAARLRGGSIVLLHDRQSEKNVDKFCAVLDSYITRIKARGFEFEKLPSSKELLAPESGAGSRSDT